MRDVQSLGRLPVCLAHAWKLSQRESQSRCSSIPSCSFLPGSWFSVQDLGGPKTHLSTLNLQWALFWALSLRSLPQATVCHSSADIKRSHGVGLLLPSHCPQQAPLQEQPWPLVAHLCQLPSWHRHRNAEAFMTGWLHLSRFWQLEETNSKPRYWNSSFSTA